MSYKTVEKNDDGSITRSTYNNDGSGHARTSTEGAFFENVSSRETWGKEGRPAKDEDDEDDE
jgi:hypothetical protein